MAPFSGIERQVRCCGGTWLAVGGAQRSAAGLTVESSSSCLGMKAVSTLPFLKSCTTQRATRAGQAAAPAGEHPQ
jgi:hypothetical protein